MKWFIGKKTFQDSITLKLIHLMTEECCRVFSIPGINDRYPPCWRYPEFAQEVALDEIQCNITRVLSPETEVDVLFDEARVVLDDILSKLDAGPVGALLYVHLQARTEK